MNSNHEYKILLDTSFMIRLLTSSDPLHDNTELYYKKFLERGDILYISTLSIAEFCRRGDISSIPLNCIRVLPFNINHALISAKFANACLKEGLQTSAEYRRTTILNDINLFAQAHDIDADYFATSDSNCEKLIKRIEEKEDIRFRHLDINFPCHEFFGELPF